MSASSVAPPPSSSNPSDQHPNASTSTTSEMDVHQRKIQDYARMKHYAALTGAILAPTLILMPPRKFDLYTVALGCGFAASASQLSKERYGRGLIDVAGSSVSEWRERQRQKAMEKENEQKKKAEFKWSSSSLPTEKARLLSEDVQQARGEERKSQGLLKRLWMGGEEEGWRERRAKEHEEALERGETIGDLIKAQVAEVWGLGESKAEELKEKDEEVVTEREKEKGKN